MNPSETFEQPVQKTPRQILIEAKAYIQDKGLKQDGTFGKCGESACSVGALRAVSGLWQPGQSLILDWMKGHNVYESFPKVDPKNVDVARRTLRDIVRYRLDGVGLLDFSDHAESVGEVLHLFDLAIESFPE